MGNQQSIVGYAGDLRQLNQNPPGGCTAVTGLSVTPINGSSGDNYDVGPFNLYYVKSTFVQIILASEMGSGEKQLTDMLCFKTDGQNSVDASKPKNFTIELCHTTLSNFASSGTYNLGMDSSLWQAAGWSNKELVYSAQLDWSNISDNTWMSMTDDNGFDDNFCYNGTDNLLVRTTILGNAYEYYSSINALHFEETLRGSSTSTRKKLYFIEDSSPYNSFDSTDSYVRNDDQYGYNIRFKY